MLVKNETNREGPVQNWLLTYKAQSLFLQGSLRARMSDDLEVAWLRVVEASIQVVEAWIQVAASSLAAVAVSRVVDQAVAPDVTLVQAHMVS